jgi:hypothetical protein
LERPILYHAHGCCCCLTPLNIFQEKLEGALSQHATDGDDSPLLFLLFFFIFWFRSRVVVVVVCPEFVVELLLDGHLSPSLGFVTK